MNNVVFSVTDTKSMGVFSKYMITGHDFTWKLKGTANAKALGILTIGGLTMDKTVVLPGMNQNI